MKCPYRDKIRRRINCCQTQEDVRRCVYGCGGVESLVYMAVCLARAVFLTSWRREDFCAQLEKRDSDTLKITAYLRTDDHKEQGHLEADVTGFDDKAFEIE